MSCPLEQAVVGRARLDVRYASVTAEEALQDPRTLAVIGFGGSAQPAGDARHVRVGLLPLESDERVEIWRGNGLVECHHDADVAWSTDGHIAFGSILIAEVEAGGIEAATASAYAQLMDWSARTGFSGLLRVWNYIDALTEGDGDGERYRQFNIGRARGIAERLQHFPAGTAIGRRDGKRLLQVYWLAALQPGMPIENPRQVSAYRYPREYGPQSPSFSRATLPRDSGLPLLVSGTAAVVGHASAHPEDVEAQLEETLLNLASLIGVAHAHRPGLENRIGARSVVKAYVRDAAHGVRVDRMLKARLPPATQYMLLEGVICRRELLVELDLLHA